MRIIALLFSLLSFAILAGETQIGTLDPRALQAERENWLVLDVRSQQEFEAGRVPGALNTPHDKIEQYLPQLADDKDQKIVLYCRSGRRAAMAAEALSEQGFTQLHLLEGDMPGWQDAGYAVEK